MRDPPNLLFCHGRRNRLIQPFPGNIKFYGFGFAFDKLLLIADLPFPLVIHFAEFGQSGSEDAEDFLGWGRGIHFICLFDFVSALCCVLLHYTTEKKKVKRFFQFFSFSIRGGNKNPAQN
jgi:hypothetical protein